MEQSIILTTKKNKKGVNSTNTLNINIDSETKLLPPFVMNGDLDLYARYVKEYNESYIYRPIITIKPYCTNVLFNILSEVVYHEGASDCKFISNNGTVFSNNSGITNYKKYKGYSDNKITKEEVMKDTGYSHKDIGPFVYHCGYDIFDNHTLRATEFTVVNKLKDSVGENEIYHRNDFNTLSDYMRDRNGKEIMDVSFNINSGDKINVDEDIKLHLYLNDNFRTFNESINDNLVEDNGWVGFVNPSNLEIPNYKEISLNKCMNNNKSCEQIDMYPDRSLYSFIPKINKYRDNRLEYNWEICLTYPCSNYYDYEDRIIDNNYYGVVGAIVNKQIIKGIRGTIESELTTSVEMEGKTILIRTDVKNNFDSNSIIAFDIIAVNEDKRHYVLEGPDNCQIYSIGYNGNDTYHYFRIHSEDLFEHIKEGLKIKELRIRKVINSQECDYYFRKFRRIPNFNNTEVYQNGVINEAEIKKYIKRKFNSSLNRVAFSETIFDEKVVENVYNEDVILKGFKDNLGRELSEIFVTIIKTNYGNEKWYGGNYSDSDIEFSHCFGTISSGLDMMPEANDFNVHKIHDISNSICDIETELKIPYSVSKLENNITIDGNNKSGEFLGDLIEFNKFSIDEVTLEDVYHRFNTKQREIAKDEFKDMFVHEIVFDDYDLSNEFSGFTVERVRYNEFVKNIDGESTEYRYAVNLHPEGYYYKPHYKIKIKEFNDIVYQGKHTKMGFIVDNIEDNIYTITTSVNYFLQKGEEIYLYDKKTLEKKNGSVVWVDKNDFTKIQIKVNEIKDNDLTNYLLFKLNPSKNDYAMELNDGTGRYLWKTIRDIDEVLDGSEILNQTFTNGAHYLYKDINFYLRRQDPNGEYGLSYEGNENAPINVKKLTIGGFYKDISVEEYISTEKEDTTCLR